jgi:molecular chaperone GrpE
MYDTYPRYASPRSHRGVSRDVAERLLAERDTLAQELQALRRAHRDLHAEHLELKRRRPAAPPAPEPTAEDPRVAQLTADLANVRRHQADAQAHALRSEKARLLGHLAGVHDDLRRALAHADPHNPWVDGIRGTQQKLEHTFAAEGAELVGTVGEAFDPHVHEAIASLPDTHLPSGSVADVIRAGVQLEDGTVVRAAQVTVSA